jgi:hypothetical protein
MISSYFYSEDAGNNECHNPDNYRTIPDDTKPRQLSLLDWMMQRTDLEPQIAGAPKP